MQKKRILYWVTIVFLSLVILVCSVAIARKLITDHQEKTKYDDIAATMESLREQANATRPTGQTQPSTQNPDDPTSEPTEPTEAGGILFEYQLLHQLNSDMVGWIQVPGTNINYPVVQTPDNANFYLDRNFYKEKAACGAIYAREMCDVNAPSDNVVLYGHNMKNGSMFGQIHDFKKQDFYESHKTIYFDTLYERHTYEVFALFLISSGEDEPFKYHLFDNAETQEEFDEFVSNCISHSFYETDVIPQYGDKLLTLSTCDRTITDGRLVLVAKRID